MTLLTGIGIAVISAAVTLFVVTVVVAIGVVLLQQEAPRQRSSGGKCGQDACGKGCHSVPELAEPALGIFKGGR